MGRAAMWRGIAFLAIATTAFAVCWNLFAIREEGLVLSEVIMPEERIAYVVDFTALPVAAGEKATEEVRDKTPDAPAVIVRRQRDFPSPVMMPEWEQETLRKKMGYTVSGLVDKHRFVKEGAKWLSESTGASGNLTRKIAESAWETRHAPLLLAMISVESDARPKLRHANNYGLCQVSTVHLARDEVRRAEKSGEGSVRRCGVSRAHDLFDIDKNLCAADLIFHRAYEKENGDARRALSRYNGNKRHKDSYSRKVWKRYRDFARKIGIPESVATR